MPCLLCQTQKYHSKKCLPQIRCLWPCFTPWLYEQLLNAGMTKTVLSSCSTKPSVFPPVWLARTSLKLSHAVVLAPCRFKAVFWFFCPSHASLPGMILLLYSQPSLFFWTIWRRAQEKIFDGEKEMRKKLSVPIYNPVLWGLSVFFRLGFLKFLYVH